MGGLGRYICVLRLFEEGRNEWTVPEMALALDAPGSTIYRTVREMVAQGFLEAAIDSRYRLGAFFIEFDRLVRVTDSLYTFGTSLLRDVVAQARIPCTAVLARLYGDTVMCIADFEAISGGIRTSYERGRPRPLIHGATSKAILAQLPNRQLTKLLSKHKSSGNGGIFPQNEVEFREELSAIRKRGYSVTRGEVDKGLAGISAPVNVPERALLGSLSLVVSAETLDAGTERRLILLVVSSASLLAEELRMHSRQSETASAGQADTTAKFA
jgi:DNA-binding IclR family transcriptional regulator